MHDPMIAHEMRCHERAANVTIRGARVQYVSLSTYALRTASVVRNDVLVDTKLTKRLDIPFGGMLAIDSRMT
jgi:hypothetical protein